MKFTEQLSVTLSDLFHTNYFVFTVSVTQESVRI